MERTDQKTHDTLQMNTTTSSHIVCTTTPENTPRSTAEWSVILHKSQSLDKDLSAIFEAEARHLRKQLLDEIAFSQWTPNRSSASTIMPPPLDLMNIFGEHALPLMPPALAVPAADLTGTVLALVDEMLARLQMEGARALRREEWRLFRAAMARQAAVEAELEEQEAVLRRQTQLYLDAQRAVLGTHYQEHLDAQKASFELQDRAREMQDIKARTALREDLEAKIKRAEDKISALRAQVRAEKEIASSFEGKFHAAQGRNVELEAMLKMSRERTAKAEAIQKKTEKEVSQAGKKIHELEGQLDTGKALVEAEKAARIEAETQLRQTTDQIADLKAKLASQTKLATSEGEMRQAQEQVLAQMKKEVAELNDNLTLERKQTSMQRDTQLTLQAELTACQTQLKEAEVLNTGLQERVQERFLRIAELKSCLIAEEKTSFRESIGRKQTEDALRAARSQMQKQDQDYGKLRGQFEEQSVWVTQLQKENQDMISTLAPIMERFKGSFAGSRPPPNEKKEDGARPGERRGEEK